MESWKNFAEQAPQNHGELLNASRGRFKKVLQGRSSRRKSAEGQRLFQVFYLGIDNSVFAKRTDRESTIVKGRDVDIVYRRHFPINEGG